MASAVVPVRQRLYRRATARRPAPRIVSLLYPTGRGSGDVRVRTWFWMHFEATIKVRQGARPFVTVSPRDWARRLHVITQGSYRDDVAERGARRVTNALQALAAARCVRRDGNHWLVLDDRGPGLALKVENAAEIAERLRKRSELAATMRYGFDDVRYNGGDAWEDAPIDLPVVLWANGWVSSLRGSSLVALMFLFDQRRQAGVGESEFFEPRRVRANYYAITEDIWRRAVVDLETQGLLIRDRLGRAGAVSRFRVALRDEMLHEQACL